MISKDPSRPKMLVVFRLSELRTGSIMLDLNKIKNIFKIESFNMRTVVFVDLNSDWEDGRQFGTDWRKLNGSELTVLLDAVANGRSS